MKKKDTGKCTNPMTQKIAPKDPLSVREKVYQKLKHLILTGHFLPGEKLTEEHLAHRMGVSRTPIREALHKLESENLILPREKRGFVISGDSKEEVEELFEIRGILEGHALRVISQKATRDLLKQLQELIEKAEEALIKNRIKEVFKCNTVFHDILNERVTDRKRLHRLIVDMRKYVLRYRKDTLQYPDGGKRTIEGHRKILLALQLRDPDLCEQIMRKHIQEAKEDAMQSLFGKSE